MLRSFLVYSKVIELYTCIYEYIYMRVCIYVLFRYGLSEHIEYSALCCTVGPCCFSSVLYIIVTSANPLPLHPFPSPLPLHNHRSVFWHSQIWGSLYSLRNRPVPISLAAPNRFISWKVKAVLKGGWPLRCEMLSCGTWHLVPVDLGIFSHAMYWGSLADPGSRRESGSQAWSRC